MLQKILDLDRPAAEKYYSLYLGRFVSDLIVPDEDIQDLLTMSTFGLPENKRTTANVQSIRDWQFAEKANEKR